jgi:16S rRNA (uracil1498-N3)-methyltransferase
MANRFYVSFTPHPGTVVLQGPEVRHLTTVMRAKPGERVVLFCGNGCEYPAIVDAVGKREVTLTVFDAAQPDRELPFHLEVATAIPKGDRGDFLVEKLTELGVTRLIPLATARSVVHPRIDRLHRTVIEASKQCGRNVLMEVAEVTQWSEYFRTEGTHKWLAHVDLNGTLPNFKVRLPGENEPSRDRERIMVAVGPEGGWTSEEIQLAAQSDWRLVGLGPRVLRIETAAIALASYFALSNAARACRNSDAD